MVSKILAGIDEAGRGCVIGPMVLAGVKASSQKSQVLAELGVRDSKSLTKKRREELRRQILKIIEDHNIIFVFPPEIDIYCFKKRLNILEAEKMAEIISALKPETVYLDAPGLGGQSFGRQVRTLVGDTSIEIIAENHADINYPIVSAASILAKVCRDEAIDRLRDDVGDFGSGYPSDPKTRNFLFDLLSSNKVPPSYVRQSWKTVLNIKQGTQQHYV